MGEDDEILDEIDINELAADLAEVYYIEKDAKSEKEGLRVTFFQEATKTFEASDLARKTVEVPDDISASDSFDYALRYNPGWILDEKQPGVGKTVILLEDPNLKPHIEVIEIPGGITEMKKGKEVTHPGYVVTKSVRSGSAMIDDERMKNSDPALYDALFVPQGFKWISDMVYEAGVDGNDVDEHIDAFLPEDWPKVLRDDLSSEEIESLKPYSFEGPKTLALLVRYAKADEI